MFQKNKILKFLTGLTIIGLGLALTGYLVSFIQSLSVFFEKTVLFNIPFFYLLTFLVFLIAYKGVLHEKHSVFIYSFMGGLMLKFIVAVAYLFIYLYFFAGEEIVGFIFAFTICYIVFTVYEVVFLVKHVPGLSSRN